jgi:hypothetical protein
MIDAEKYQPARQNMKFVNRCFHFNHSHNLRLKVYLVVSLVISYEKYMLSGCELIDTENISLPSQNMKLGGQ